MMFPQLGIRMRTVPESLQFAKRALLIIAGNYCTGGKIDGKPDHILRRDFGFFHDFPDGMDQYLKIVSRIFQRPVRRQNGFSVRKHPVHHAVRIRHRGNGRNRPVPAVHQDGPDTQSPVINSQCISVHQHSPVFP